MNINVYNLLEVLLQVLTSVLEPYRSQANRDEAIKLFERIRLAKTMAVIPGKYTCI